MVRWMALRYPMARVDSGFPPGTHINGTLTIARSGPAYLQSHGTLPDFEWLDYSPQIPNVIPGDTLRLANSRDMLIAV